MRSFGVRSAPRHVTRALAVCGLVVLVGSGCGIAFIGTEQIDDHCSYQVGQINYCHGGEHTYDLTGICFVPGNILPFQAALRFDERTGEAVEQIRVLHQGSFLDGSLVAH